MRASRGGERWYPARLGPERAKAPLRFQLTRRRWRNRDGKIYLRAASTPRQPFVAGRGEKFAFFAIFFLPFRVRFRLLPILSSDFFHSFFFFFFFFSCGVLRLVDARKGGGIERIWRGSTCLIVHGLLGILCIYRRIARWSMNWKRSWRLHDYVLGEDRFYVWFQ